MRAARKWFFDCRSNLRAKCFFIGYWHLITILVSTSCHVAVVFTVTSGFRCEISRESLRAAQWDWLETVLLIINFGAHGFYAFPLIFNYHHADLRGIQYLPIPENNPSCPGMSELSCSDIMYFVFNMLWLMFVLSFIIGVHKKNAGPMITFIGATCFKLFLQLHGFMFMSSYNNAILDILYKIVDVWLIISFLIIIKKHIQIIRYDKSRKESFVESLLDAFTTDPEKKNNSIFVVPLQEKPLSAVSKEKC